VVDDGSEVPVDGMMEAHAGVGSAVAPAGTQHQNALVFTQ